MSLEFYRPIQSIEISKTDRDVKPEKAVRLYCVQAGSWWSLQIRAPLKLRGPGYSKDFIIANASLGVADLCAVRDASVAALDEYREHLDPGSLRQRVTQGERALADAVVHLLERLPVGPTDRTYTSLDEETAAVLSMARELVR